jgi:hypothetical protein
MSPPDYYDTKGLDPEDTEIIAKYDFLWERRLAANGVFENQGDENLTIRKFTLPDGDSPTYTADFVYESFRATYTCQPRPFELTIFNFQLRSMNESMESERPRIIMTFECVTQSNDIGQPFLKWKMFQNGIRIAWRWASRRRLISGRLDNAPRRLSDEEKETLEVTREDNEEHIEEKSDDEQVEERDEG